MIQHCASFVGELPSSGQQQNLSRTECSRCTRACYTCAHAAIEKIDEFCKPHSQLLKNMTIKMLFIETPDFQNYE